MTRSTWNVHVRIWSVRGHSSKLALDKSYRVRCQRAITAGARAVRALQRDYKRRLTRTTTVNFTVSKVRP